MVADFVGVLEIEEFELLVARDVVFYSFIVQKSIAHLDLNACEYMSRRRSIFTEEGCRKMFKPRRVILYKLHLDLPRYPEIKLRDFIPNSVNQSGLLRVDDCVYNQDLAPYIVNSIWKTENKFEKLRRYLNVMKLLKLHQLRKTTTFLYDNIMQILYPDCTDSELVVEFALSFCFFTRIFLRDSPTLVSFVLHHAQRLRYNIWQTYEGRVDPVNGCIVAQMSGNGSKLLEYGADLHFEFQVYIDALSQYFDPRNLWYIAQWNVRGRHRIFLSLQLLWTFVCDKQSLWEVLCYNWRCIPDPYLTDEEIYFAFGGVIPINLQVLVYYYNFVIVEEVQSDYVVPRSLQQLCRVAIRSSLARNYELPDGINQLHIPDDLKSYLKLEC